MSTESSPNRAREYTSKSCSENPIGSPDLRDRRWGISYILGKYVSLAKQNPEFSADFPATPHVLRHSKAMGMLKAGINLIYIRDFLGHVNVTSTEVYARADNEMKRKYLDRTS